MKVMNWCSTSLSKMKILEFAFIRELTSMLKSGQRKSGITTAMRSLMNQFGNSYLVRETSTKRRSQSTIWEVMFKVSKMAYLLATIMLSKIPNLLCLLSLNSLNTTKSFSLNGLLSRKWLQVSSHVTATSESPIHSQMTIACGLSGPSKTAKTSM